MIFRLLSRRYGAVLCAVVAVLILNGYTYGSFDQIIYLPFLFKTFHPELYIHDPFLQLKNHYYSYFWLLLQPLYYFGVFEIGLFVIHVISLVMLFISIRNFAAVFSGKKTFLLLCTVGFTVPHLGFSGFTLTEFSILNRTFALPLLIQSMAWYLSGKKLRSFILIGLTANIHSIYALMGALALLYDAWRNRNRTGYPEIIKFIAVLGVCALPVGIWFAWSTVTTYTYYDVSQWLAAMKTSLLAHLFDPFSFKTINLLLMTNGISLVVMYHILFRKLKLSPKLTILRRFYSVFLVIIVVHIISVTFLPLEFIAKTQALRAGIFVTFITYFLYYYYVFNQYESGTLSRNRFIYLSSAGSLSVSPLLLLLAYPAGRFVRGKTSASIAIVLVTVAFLIQMSLSYKFGVFKFGFRIFSPQTAYVEAQRFAEKNTPVDSVFIAVPYLWDVQETEWRVFSKRATVASYSDSLEIAYYPPYLTQWSRRMEDLMPGALATVTGDFFTDRTVMKNIFYTNTERDFISVSRKYNARYLVIEKPYCYKFRKIFENRQFIIYDLSGGRIEGSCPGRRS